MRIGVTTAVAALGVVLAQGARAQAFDATNPASVVAAVKAFGQKAKLGTTDKNEPMIRAESDGISYVIFFYDCTNGTGCLQLQFSSAFDLEPGLTTDFVNDWNEKWVTGRLSVDASGDPVYTFAVITDGGLSEANFQAILSTWTGTLADVVKDIGY